MALFKINKGNSTNLPTTYHEGYCYLTTDDGKFYIDTTNTETGRIVLNALKTDTFSDTGYLLSNQNINFKSTTTSSDISLFLTPGKNYKSGGYWLNVGYTNTNSHGTYSRSWWEQHDNETGNLTLLSLTAYGWSRSVPIPYSGVIDVEPTGEQIQYSYTPNPWIKDIFYLKFTPKTTDSTPENTLSTIYSHYLTYTTSSIDNNKLISCSSTGELTTSTANIGDTSTPVYVSDGTIVACTGIQTVGLTHVGNDEPTSTNYVLWVDEDETDSQAMRADAIKYKTFSIATSAWSGSGPYTYAMAATGITANSAIINLTLDAASQTYQKAQLDWETTTNQIILSTATKPTGTIAGYLIAADVAVI